MKRVITIGVSFVAALLLAGCTSSAPPLPPTATVTPVPIVEPSKDVLSDTEVDSRGFERSAEAEERILHFASLGDTPGAVPDPGAQSFPTYAKQSGAALPTAEYALNLIYWGCEQAKENPTGAKDINEFAVATVDAAAAVTGYDSSSTQATVYSELMFRGMEQLCEPELTKFENYTPVGVPE